MLSIERFAAIAAAALSISACSMSASDPSGSPALARDTSIGTVLTDSNGMTLYTLSSDENGKSTCDGRCAKAWPPFFAPSDAKPSGKWTVTKRNDGAPQWAYASKPLYFWEKDKQPGDVTGHKYGEVWWAARP